MPKFKITARRTIEFTLTVDVEPDLLEDDELSHETAMDYIENVQIGEIETVDSYVEVQTVKKIS